MRSAVGTSCTSCAISRSPRTTLASGRPARASAPSTVATARASSPTWSGSRRPRRSGSSADSTTPSRRFRWGSSTPSFRWSGSRRRRSRGFARCSRCPPSPCACSRRASTRAKTATRACSSSPTTPTCSSTQARRRRRDARPTRPSARPTSRSSRGARSAQSHRAHLAHGRAAAHAAVDRRARARRHRPCRDGARRPQLGGLRGRAARCPVHPGRHQPVQRLLRRAPRRGHGGPPGPGARHGRGPRAATAGGLVPPGRVLVATYVSFGLAVLCGVYLVAVAGWVLLLIGAASILAGVLYTGGPRPYGYEGLGEVFVFLFFGIVAVAGSYYVQTERLEWEAFVLAVPVGLLAAAILVVNNVRDLETDRRAGKRTLAVRLGRGRTRGLYAAMVYLAFLTAPLPWVAGSLSPWLLLPWLTLPLAASVVRLVRQHTDGPTLNEALARTGLLQLLFCVL